MQAALVMTTRHAWTENAHFGLYRLMNPRERLCIHPNREGSLQQTQEKLYFISILSSYALIHSIAVTLRR